MPRVYLTNRRLTRKDKINIIMCTYHSLTAFDSRMQSGYKTARELRLIPQTVYAALKRFESLGQDLERFVAG
jgi:hypothetical protein